MDILGYFRLIVLLVPVQIPGIVGQFLFLNGSPPSFYFVPSGVVPVDLRGSLISTSRTQMLK